MLSRLVITFLPRSRRLLISWLNIPESMKENKSANTLYNKNVPQRERKGEGDSGMIWENCTETCIISYKKRIASPGSIQNTGCLGLVHWDDPEG